MSPAAPGLDAIRVLERRAMPAPTKEDRARSPESPHEPRSFVAGGCDPGAPTVGPDRPHSGRLQPDRPAIPKSRHPGIRHEPSGDCSLAGASGSESSASAIPPRTAEKIRWAAVSFGLKKIKAGVAHQFLGAPPTWGVYDMFWRGRAAGRRPFPGRLYYAIGTSKRKSARAVRARIGRGAGGRLIRRRGRP